MIHTLRTISFSGLLAIAGLALWCGDYALRPSAYLTHGDPSLAGLDAAQLITRANDVAGLAVLSGQVSSTGRVYEELNRGAGFAR